MGLWSHGVIVWAVLTAGDGEELGLSGDDTGCSDRQSVSSRPNVRSWSCSGATGCVNGQRVGSGPMVRIRAHLGASGCKPV